MAQTVGATSYCSNVPSSKELRQCFCHGSHGECRLLFLHEWRGEHVDGSQHSGKPGQLNEAMVLTGCYRHVAGSP